MSATMHYLSADCFVCNTQNYWIILNATQDKYLCVVRDELRSVGHRLYGWKDEQSGKVPPPALSNEANGLIESLVSNGVITRNRSDGKPFAETHHHPRERSIEGAEHRTLGTRSLHSCLDICLACAKVDWYLRTKALFPLLNNIQLRRRRCNSSRSVYDTICVSALITTFKAYRPLYPHPYLCLFESLALQEFLAAHRFFPNVVFGVIADPFQAHCWLQSESVVLNDDLERVSRYKPILSA